MLHYIDHTKMGRGSHGWLDSHFHFSFAEYFNPDNIRFGILRVLNDDIVQSGQGFPTHPHRDMEIISYVIQGELSHKDSMGNSSTLKRGQSQYMSAGTGVTHSEYNHGAGELRFMQMWIVPDKKGYQPNYGDYRFVWEDRAGKWLPIASGYGNETSTAPIRIHADANVFAAFLSAGESIDFKLEPNRQAYLVLLEGDANVENIAMTERDALEIIKQDVTITTKNFAHLYVVDMPFEEACYKAKYGDEGRLNNGA
ncbi:MAG: pirin family protein [Burkholderiales bacterium]|jgi:redox-sensitive bicupin YhaK (pirin superfamily)|nr:pirin family protein [Burkholderiales bacterium]